MSRNSWLPPPCCCGYLNSPTLQHRAPPKRQTGCVVGCTAVWVPEDVLEAHGIVLPDRLLPTLSCFNVTHLLATPSLLLRLSELPNASLHLRSLCYVASSGDALTHRAACAIAAVLPEQAAFVSLYGCTETCADALCYNVRAGVTSSHRRYLMCRTMFALVCTEVVIAVR